VKNKFSSKLYIPKIYQLGLVILSWKAIFISSLFGVKIATEEGGWTKSQNKDTQKVNSSKKA
jgi:hypothetical protein